MLLQITLVPIEPGHADAIQRLVQSGRSIIEQTRLPDPYPEDGAARWIEHARPRYRRGDEYTFVVQHGADVAGVCGLIVSDDGHEAELGYWVGRPHWGRGIATEAARLAVAFEQGDLSRVVALPLATNAPSRRVLEKAGLRFTGTRLAEAPWGGQEQAVYEVIRKPRARPRRTQRVGGRRLGAAPRRALRAASVAVAARLGERAEQV